MANPIVHFEIPADDVARARAFYSKVFGWKISDPWKMDYFLVETKDKKGNGINGGLMKRKMPGQPFMNYIDVASLDAALAAAQSAGGSVCMPKMEIGPGMGWIAAFLDTEGNAIGLHQAGPKSQPAPARRKAVKKAVKKTAKKAVKKKAKKKAARRR